MIWKLLDKAIEYAAIGIVVIFLVSILAVEAWLFGAILRYLVINGEFVGAMVLIAAVPVIAIAGCAMAERVRK